MSLFETRNLAKHFGGLAVVSDLSFSLEENEIVGLIGPNGAGKSTVFNVICGVYQPDGGRIFFRGEEIGGKRPDEVVARGIARTFQTTRLFMERTVVENVVHGRHVCTKAGIFQAVTAGRNARKEDQENEKKTHEILSFMGIFSFRDHLAKNIPLGFQRRLAIAVALATEPKVLLLDEPTVGMNPLETSEMMDLISRLRDRGVTVLLVEHDMKVVMGICQRVIVFSYGKKIAEGSPEEIRNNREVIEAYLGKGAYA
jgi:branched-chain amino acid transport system ATP-binding protein